jgi:hypothetical protein
MKYCPQCNKQYSEAWLTFCTDDGSLLREDLTPAADPNWDPRIRKTQFDDPSEHTTQWLPRDPATAGGGWVAPDERVPDARQYERGPVARPWQPPAPPLQPYATSSPPGVAIASLVVGIIGLMVGFLCAIPIPGIVAVILGFVALSQMKKAPNPTGRGLAIGGIVLGGINLLFFIFGILWFILSLIFG